MHKAQPSYAQVCIRLLGLWVVSRQHGALVVLWRWLNYHWQGRRRWSGMEEHWARDEVAAGIWGRIVRLMMGLLLLLLIGVTSRRHAKFRDLSRRSSGLVGSLRTIPRRVIRRCVGRWRRIGVVAISRSIGRLRW
jgi:hypothetical protein